MEAQSTFCNLFFGGEIQTFMFSLFLVILGLVLYILVRIRNRKEVDSRVSWTIWWKGTNNALELLISLLFVYPQIRFAQVYEGWIMSIVPDTFSTVPFFVMLASGYLQHYILVKLFRWTK